MVDHINHDTLDNRRQNLRVVTRRQNQANMRKCSKATSSKYKGVSWDKSRNKWMAALGPKVEGKTRRIHLGRFDREEDAALAYNKGASALFGVFAKLNKVLIPE